MTVKAFVSSTFVDLRRHRERAIRQLRDLGLAVHPMEDWPPDFREPTEFCPERVRDCQLCVLLVGFRRGWVPPAGGGRSITQMEFDEAVRLRIPVLPFLADDGDWPAEFDDRGKDHGLAAWRDEVRPRAGADRFHFRADPQTLDVGPAVGLWREAHDRADRLAAYLRGVARAADPARVFVEPAVAAREIDPDSDPVGWGPLTPLLEAVARHPRLTLLGGAGAGKTAAADWVAGRLAADGPNPWKEALPGVVPVPAAVRDLGAGRGVTWPGLLHLLAGDPARQLLGADHVARLLQTGRGLLILDGLDEVPDPQARADLLAALRAGVASHPEVRWLLTARPAAGAGADGAVLHLAPFGDARVAAFADRWYAAREPDPVRAGRAAADLVRAVRQDPGVARLARHPALLGLMAAMHRDSGAVPAGRGLLYEEAARAYLMGRDAARGLPVGPAPLRDQKRGLARVGFELHARRAAGAGPRPAARADEVTDWLAAAAADAGRPADDPDQALYRLIHRAGFLTEPAPGRVAFAQESAQAYFAAVHLRETVLTPGWLAGPRTDLARYAAAAEWREPLQFLFELLGEEAVGWRAAARDAAFGAGWAAVEGAASGPAAVLLARLADDESVGWGRAERDGAAAACLRWAAARSRAAPADPDARAVTAVALGGRCPDVPGRFAELARHTAGAEALDLTDTRVTDLRPAAALAGLRRLTLTGTPVADLGPVAGLPELRSLVVSSTRVADLAPVRGLRRLEHLDAGDTPVEDLAPLAGLPLRTVNLSFTPVADLGPLGAVPTLQMVILTGSRAGEAERARLEAAVPGVVIVP